MVSEVSVYCANESVAQGGSSSPGREGNKQNTLEAFSFYSIWVKSLWDDVFIFMADLPTLG